MRLGFWNRLAITATAGAALIVPTHFVLTVNQSMLENRAMVRQLCEQSARQLGNFSECDQEYRASLANDLGPADWFTAAAQTLLACAAIYVLLLGLVSIARWIWRGRMMKNTDTA